MILPDFLYLKSGTMATNMEYTYDYSSNEYSCGFSRFPDGSKFKYGHDGEVCLSTDCSSWAKRLLHNLPLPDYIDSEELVPPSEFLSFPEFGTLEKKKMRKESVGNYIEDCEFCGQYMDKTFRFYKNLVCEPCNKVLNKEKCTLCNERPNMYAEMFIEDYNTSVPFVTRFLKDMTVDSDIYYYCTTCNDNLAQLSNAYFNGNDTGETWFQAYNRMHQEDFYELETCPGCGANTGGSICYWCRIEM